MNWSIRGGTHGEGPWVDVIKFSQLGRRPRGARLQWTLGMQGSRLWMRRGRRCYKCISEIYTTSVDSRGPLHAAGEAMLQVYFRDLHSVALFD